MDYKKYERHMPVCLECGDRIKYGRTDKKFCCDECRNKNFYERERQGRVFRRRILKTLSRNYEILEGLLRADVETAEMISILAMGFSPSIMTSCRKCGRHYECGCFDIRYIMTDTRIYSISKIQNFD